jgi:nitroreductase
MTTTNGRTADFPIDPIFLHRWSPRHLTGEFIPDSELHIMFEAARWAPSSSNLQPWRYLYAKRDTPDWALFCDPLVEGNKRWVAGASALVAVVSKLTGQQQGTDAVKANYTHSFDAGASWAYLALQASRIGWVAHAMGGVDYPRATKDLEIPEGYRLECMVAIGRYKAPPENAPPPNSRSPQSSFVRAGVFKA